MKNPTELTRADMLVIVKQLQAILYEEDDGSWNPEKTHDADTTESICLLLQNFDLGPVPGKIRYRCVVDASDANGVSGFFGCVVYTTQEGYDEGDHYDQAKAKAEDAGYGGVMVVHDENDGPDWLFEKVFGTTQEIS